MLYLCCTGAEGVVMAGLVDMVYFSDMLYLCCTGAEGVVMAGLVDMVYFSDMLYSVVQEQKE